MLVYLNGLTHSQVHTIFQKSGYYCLKTTVSRSLQCESLLSIVMGHKSLVFTVVLAALGMAPLTSFSILQGFNKILKSHEIKLKSREK